jgi:hypothetical protein
MRSRPQTFAGVRRPRCSGSRCLSRFQEPVGPQQQRAPTAEQRPRPSPANAVANAHAGPASTPRRALRRPHDNAFRTRAHGDRDDNLGAHADPDDRTDNHPGWDADPDPKSTP